jgi:hypothetical protein
VVSGRLGSKCTWRRGFFNWAVLVVGMESGIASVIVGGFSSLAVSMAVRFSSWAISLSVNGAIGDPSEGCLSARIMSLTPAKTGSVEDTRRMVTWRGNHARVSAIHSR